MKPCISIIIAVYNSEKSLPQCIESLQKQTMRNIEFIFINDGSKDKSLDILNEYKTKDNRIKVLDQSNGGVSIARNNGMQESTGKYMFFVDSDDWIEPTLLEKLYDIAERFNSEITFCGLSVDYLYNNKSIESKYSILKNEPMNKEYVKSYILIDFFDSGRFGNVFKLYKRNFVINNKFKFDVNTSLGEDWAFNIEAFQKCNTAVYIDECLYHYVQVNPQSLMKKYRPKLFEGYMQSKLPELANNLGINDKNMQIKLSKRKCFVAFWLCVINEYKKDCPNKIFQKYKNILKMLKHERICEAVKVALKYENSFPKKVFLIMIRLRFAIGFMILGKAYNIKKAISN